MCITPNEFVVRLGNFGQYCPVSLAERAELVDCSTDKSLTFAAEFRGKVPSPLLRIWSFIFWWFCNEIICKVRDQSRNKSKIKRSCLNTTFIYVGHYYKMAGQEELDQFLKEPEKYVPPLAPRKLPPPELLPTRKTAAEAKAMFPAQIQLKGYCPVTYLDGKCRYEAIVPGNNNLIVEYRGKLYFFESEGKLDKFMR